MRVQRFIFYGLCLLVLLALTACDSGASGTASAQGQPTATHTPLLVTPKTSSGKPGQGATVVTTASPVPGGPEGSQQVALHGRTLIIYKVTSGKSAQANSTLINIELAIKNTSQQAIQNLAGFFELIGTEGDSFSYQYNSTDTFYGPIAAGTTDKGLIVFQLPSAAAAHLSLLYRPEVSQDTVIVPLTIAH